MASWAPTVAPSRERLGWSARCRKLAARLGERLRQVTQVVMLVAHHVSQPLTHSGPAPRARGAAPLQILRSQSPDTGRQRGPLLAEGRDEFGCGQLLTRVTARGGGTPPPRSGSSSSSLRWAPLQISRCAPSR